MHRSRVCSAFTFTAGVDSSLCSCDFFQRGSDGFRCLPPLDCSSGGVEVHVIFVTAQLVRHEFVLIIQRNCGVVHIGQGDAVSC
jgi:hypothetical protein